MILKPSPSRTVVLSNTEQQYLAKLVKRQLLNWEGRVDACLDITLELSETERGLASSGLKELLRLLNGR